jgi:pimeloyl-ACP methyl ester carboxylesterase
MSEKKSLNDRGNHQGEFTQGVGGWAEYTVYMTETTDTVRHDVVVPPNKVIPVIFLPGVMGSNLRMSKKRQDDFKRKDNRAWRPDDLAADPTDIVRGVGFGGWFKNASPAQRQLDFDPNETEVEYYHYTESDERFDPWGPETMESDARHKNVPDTLSPIPPLMGHFTSFAPDPEADVLNKQRKFATTAQIARWRGWSEVFFDGPYGTMLKTAEQYMNNMVKKGEVGPLWRARPHDALPGSAHGGAISDLLMQNPKAFGASFGDPISKADLKTIASCWYPVHAMGYNFIKSNAASAVEIAHRIRGLVNGYRKRHLKCDEVIIVTHSMGGLLARALIHPDYGNLLNDKDVKVLGIYHNVMPTAGAAGAYKRMRFGFQENHNLTVGGYLDGLTAKIFGPDGEHSTAILANAPAPLEMMPATAYGYEWLKVTTKGGDLLWSWPGKNETALTNIYLQPPNKWWRLINPNWVNPGNVLPENGGGIDKVLRRLENATKFLDSIETTFHPKTYASYCASPHQKSYGDIIFTAVSTGGGDVDGKGDFIPWPSPETWILLTDDKKGKLTVRAGQRTLTLELQPAAAPGDQTVPASRSAKQIKGILFEHGNNGHGYEHQGSYSDPQVLASLMFSLVQIAKSARWGKT